MSHLQAVLASQNPAAAILLRDLLGGRIVVNEVRRADAKRHYLRGTLCMKLCSVAKQLGQGEGTSLEDSPSIAIDFRELERYEELADSMKADFDAGMSVDEINKKLGCSYTVFTKAMNYWHELRGLPRPDGRSQRGRLPSCKASDKLQAEVMELWDQDLLVGEIAEKLDCGLETVREAVVAWHESRGLAVPDGRQRRKEIRLRRKAKSDPAGK